MFVFIYKCRLGVKGNHENKKRKRKQEVVQKFICNTICNLQLLFFFRDFVFTQFFFSIQIKMNPAFSAQKSIEQIGWFFEVCFWFLFCLLRGFSCIYKKFFKFFFYKVCITKLLREKKYQSLRGFEYLLKCFFFHFFNIQVVFVVFFWCVVGLLFFILGQE